VRQVDNLLLELQVDSGVLLGVEVGGIGNRIAEKLPHRRDLLIGCSVRRPAARQSLQDCAGQHYLDYLGLALADYENAAWWHGAHQAFVLKPKLLIADEPVSPLDVSIRAGILNLLVDLQRSTGFSCLFTTHDLSVAELLCDRAAVMYLGEIAEVGSRDEVFGDAWHLYTRSLLAPAPIADPVLQRSRERSVMPGEPPSAVAPPSGCSLHPRCPLANERCSQEVPATTTVSDSGHLVHCHRVAEQLSLEVSRR